MQKEIQGRRIGHSKVKETVPVIRVRNRYSTQRNSPQDVGTGIVRHVPAAKMNDPEYVELLEREGYRRLSATEAAQYDKPETPEKPVEPKPVVPEPKPQPKEESELNISAGARKLIEEHVISDEQVAHIKGTGKDGTILKKDVEAILNQ